MVTFLMILFLIVCTMLILIVLLQKGRGGGLGAAFGGGGSSAFGARTGDVLTWVTIVLTGLFLILAVVLVLAVHNSIDRSELKTPVASHTGAITDVTRVRLTCESKKAKMHYTINGEEPTEKDKLYPALGTGIKVKPGDTLKARAFRSDAEPSKVLTVKYKKLVAPKIQIPVVPTPTTAPAVPAAPAVPTSAPAVAA